MPIGKYWPTLCRLSLVDFFETMRLTQIPKNSDAKTMHYFLGLPLLSKAYYKWGSCRSNLFLETAVTLLRITNLLTGSNFCYKKWRVCH